ncbi:unnamed protein product, partial [Didymodactylos carnosus]
NRSSFPALESTSVNNRPSSPQQQHPVRFSTSDEMPNDNLTTALDVPLQSPPLQQQDVSIPSPTSANDHLKDEILHSLNDEILSLTSHNQSYEVELQNSKRLHLQYQQQISECDALLRDLRSKESDYLETIIAKDSQIALLRIRLQESDDLCKQKQQLIEQLQVECQRILKDHTDSSG